MSPALILALFGGLALVAFGVQRAYGATRGGIDLAAPMVDGVNDGARAETSDALAWLAPILSVQAEPAAVVTVGSADVADRNVRAFLAMIRDAEGTSGPNGYRTMFGGELFDSFADHPRQAITRSLGGKRVTSTAAGAYQFLSTTWDECRAALQLPDFSPESQDRAAVYLIQRRGALADVRAGRFDAAVQKVAREWASMPGSPYGQPVKTLAHVRAVYETNGGAYA